jgi:histidinol-phosphate aminotransferase
MTVPGTYSAPVTDPAVDLDLSRNEGRADAVALFSALPELGPLVSRYPDTSALRRRLAELNRVDPDQVLVTAGGDDALHRCFLALVGGGGRAVATTPTFEMIPVYAGQVGARLTEVPWVSTPFPAAAVAAAVAGGATAFLVSPNNPTGSVLTLGDLEQVAAAAPHVVLDAAYGEFADTDLSPAAVGLGNTVVVRTLSKAYGLAGLRVGYLLGPPDLVARIGGHGGPYPVAALSAAIAEARLCSPREVLDDFVAEVRTERGELTALLERLGTTPLPSQANFVLTRCGDAAQVTRRAAELGVALRGFADRPGMEGMVRITLPGDRADFARLVAVLESVLSPRNGAVS